VFLPHPARWLTAYHQQDRAGIYLVWEDESSLYDVLEQEADSLRQETGLALTFDRSSRWIGISRNRAEIGSEDEQIKWLCDTANRLVNALRPRLSALAR
jgi:hypothetical protein